MTPRLVLRPHAETELLDARDWYADQRPGLGDAFATEVDSALGGILQAPLAYPRVRVRYAVRSYDASRTRFTSARRPMRSSYLPSSMVDGILNGGSRGADVELRSRADRWLAFASHGCSPRPFGALAESPAGRPGGLLQRCFFGRRTVID